MLNEKGKLYIVATPIGNLGDMTLRAIETLKQVSVIFCEDTRQFSKLAGQFQIEKPAYALHQHSGEKVFKRVFDYLEKGEDVAYVSDAGTPGISDPGGVLVEAVIKNGFEVIPIPGPSAIITALSVSGFPTDKFLFLGFIPHKGRTKFYQQIEDSKITVGFYESTHRILRTLEELISVIKNRQIVVARELTKQFETIYRGTATEVLEEVKKMSKGEFVIIISGK